MKFQLIVISMACVSYLVTPVWSTGLLAAKAAAVVGAAKGAALLGAGMLAAKSELLKNLAEKKAAHMKPIIITQGKPPCHTKPELHKPIELKPIHKPHLENKHENCGQEHIIEIQSDQQPLIWRWDPDTAMPVLELPYARTLHEVNKHPVVIEKPCKHEIKKPCPIHLVPVSVPSKYPMLSNKVSKMWELISGAVQTKKKLISELLEPMEHRKKPVVYQIVPHHNFYTVPVEEQITIEK